MPRSRLAYPLVLADGATASVAFVYCDLAGVRVARVSVVVGDVTAEGTFPADVPPALLCRLAELGASVPRLADVVDAAVSDWRWRSCRSRVA